MKFIIIHDNFERDRISATQSGFQTETKTFGPKNVNCGIKRLDYCLTIKIGYSIISNISRDVKNSIFLITNYILD